MRSTTTAASTRSLRCFGNSFPRLGSPTWWPARPMRCRPRLTAPGDSTWMTRSTAPMSMPSSSDEVATRPLSSPRFSWSSMKSRRSRLSEPWWAITSSWPGSGDVPVASAERFTPSRCSSLSRVASRSARRRAFTKMMVDRCSWTSSSRRGWMRRPDRAAHRAAGCGAADRLVDDLAQRAHVLHRHDDLDVEGLAHPGVDDGDGTGLPRGAVVPGEEPGDLVERALGGRQPDALDGRVGDGVETLEGEREVGAPLGGGQGVDLVDDHGLHTAEVLPGRRREHQVERLGRGDEQVGRVAQHAAALVGGGVAGAHAHDRRVERLAQALGGEADAGQRRPQVLLDVDRQGPQRGDVDQPGAVLAVAGRRRRHQAVEAPEEGGEGLAGAGGGQHQGVVARRDGRPALGLRRGGLGEGGGEPGADRRREAFERVGRGHPVEATDA